MAKVKGTSLVLKWGSDDISQYTNTSDFNMTADVENVSGYGVTSNVYGATLKDGTFTCGGVYDSTASTGPRAVIQDTVGTTVEITRQPEGTGSGKPQDVFDLVVNAYTESAPVAGHIAWTAGGQISGDVDSTAQSA